MDKTEFFGLCFPTALFLGTLLIELGNVHTVQHILLYSIFILSYAYTTYKLTLNFTRDVYNIALKVENMFNSPHKHMLNSFVATHEISFEELLKLPENVPLMVNRDVVIMKLTYPFENIQLKTWVKEGGGFDVHNHPDCLKFISVTKGELRCKTQDIVTKVGETLIIPPGEYHHPYAEMYTELMVYFKKV